MSSSHNAITPESFECGENGYPKGVKIDVYQQGVETPLYTIEITYYSIEKGELCGTSALSKKTEAFSFNHCNKNWGWRRIFSDPMTDKPVFSKSIKYDLRLSATQ